MADMRDSTLSDDELRARYGIADNRDWKLSKAREALKTSNSWADNILNCAFRPFDDRPCFFGHEFMDYPRRELMQHVAHRDNLALLVSRQIGTAEWRHSFTLIEPPNDCCVISDMSSEANYAFPLWLYANNKSRTDNFTPDFRTFLDKKYNHQYEAQEILGYIYAVLHAPTYRTRFSEFLRIDFPRIPFPDREQEFGALSDLGWELAQAHLLKEYPNVGLAKYHGKGDHEVEAVRYSEVEQAVWINKNQ